MTFASFLLYFQAHPDYWVGWDQISAELGHQKRAIRRWRDQYHLPTRKVAGRVLLRRQHLDEWILEMDRTQRELASQGIHPRKRGLHRRHH